MIVRLLPLTLLFLTGCSQLQRLLPTALRSEERLANSVTIVRDEWGVATIYAPSDAAAAFGIAFAQAEDDFWQVEEEYIHALGRAANFYGKEFLAADLMKAAFEVERLSREEYDREPDERKAVWSAFAEGLNYYMRVRQARPRLIPRYEPWMLLARFRDITAGMSIDGVRLGDSAGDAAHTSIGAATADAPIALVAARVDSIAGTRPVSPDRSLAWILAPGRTAAGHAMLVQRRHVNLFGPGQLYEVHVHSEDGWHARGTALLGTPVPMSGQNEHLAWATTPGSADFADVYELTFDHPTDPLMYRYESGWRRAEQWSDTIFVNTPHGVEPRRYTFLRTDHGPVVARSADRAYAVSIARMREGGALQQSYAMSRAATLDGFNDALEQRSLVATNTLVADREGNIQIVYGGAVPRRDPSFDWSRPVDGSIARTGWDGYQALQDLPQSRNPRGGWLASTADSTDPRIATVRRVLESDSVWTFDAVAASAFDTHVGIAGPTTAPLVREWEDIGGTNPARAMPVDDALDTLRLWDRISTIESTAMSLFVYWQEQLHTMGESRAAYRHFLAFESALERLAREHGARLVPWGDVMRLQRVRPRDGTPFSDDQPSLPLAGGPAWTGIIFDAESWQPPGLKHRYATSTSWIGVYELSPDSRARSIAVFGTSPDPASPHYMDQAALFARGELKTAWFSRDDVTASARRTYRPAPVDAIR